MRIELREDELKSLFKYLVIGWMLTVILIFGRLFFDHYSRIEMARLAIQTSDNSKSKSSDSVERHRKQNK